jgi:hypothetical protein
MFRNVQGAALTGLSADNVLALCQAASDRARAVSMIHPQFTLHDEVHFVRVTELMAMLLGTTLSELNSVERALLILAAHYHDQGMIPDADDVERIRNSPEFQMHRDLWAIEHPNMHEILDQLANPAIREGERLAFSLKIAELENALWAEFLRRNHGEESGRFVRKTLTTDPRLFVDGVPIADSLALLCESHVLDPRELQQLPMDRLVSTSTVNLRFLAIILRLADILDFDRERTPDSLYRTVHFTSGVSVQEWEKHRGVLGWTIRPDLIRFEMEFEHPIYERTARQFLDYVEAELSAGHELIRSFPAEFSRYQLQIPARVDRSRIGPKNNAYVYHDLEFSLSRDEIVKLLMTESLYGSPALCVRELLQNALDALRYRKALFQIESLNWLDGLVEFVHGVDENGCEYLSCTDNGVGMDEEVIRRFLTRVGRSYYRSPYFEQERIRFRAKGVDFDPCSRFGIGFMSAFMLGDRISIQTRRDYGYGKERGKPWIVEVNGLSSIVTLRPGSRNQPVGTAMRITCRPQTKEEDPRESQEPEDRVQLWQTLEYFAHAVEYPIQARFSESDKPQARLLEPKPRRPTTPLEHLGITALVRFDKDIGALDGTGLVHGCVSQSFLCDANGVPVLENEEAVWTCNVDGIGDLPDERNRRIPVSELPPPTVRISDARLLRRPGQSSTRVKPAERVICADGIRVSHQSEDKSGHDIETAFMLDTRGAAKPALTPARRIAHCDRQSRYLWDLIWKAEQQIWADIASMVPERLSREVWWKLSALYQARELPGDLLWSRIGIREYQTGRFLDLAESNPFRYAIIREDPEFRRLVTCRDEVVAFADVSTVIRFTELALADKKLELRVSRTNESRAKWRNAYVDHIVRFPSELRRALSAFSGSHGFVNPEHPLIAFMLSTSYDDPLGKFTRELLQRGTFTRELLLSDVGSDPPFIMYIKKYQRDAARAYMAVRWDRAPADARPPYLVYDEDKGWRELGEKEILSWASLQIDDDE